MVVPRLAFPRTAAAACLGGFLLASACTGPDASPASEEASGSSEVHHPDPAADILSTNAFYYYRDVEAAWVFYRDLLGFETVADYGFAKILRVGPASYLTLVDEARGMHSADEPRSVTLAIVTEEVEGWWAYLSEREVPMRAPLGEVEPGRPHDGFVAIDPEGYFLEFERFNPHDENVDLLPLLADVEPLGPVAGTRPGELRVQGTVLWLYYRDLPAMERFWESLLGVDLLVDQGWAKVYQASRTGFIGLVDGDRGLHQASDEKSVTVSFFTSDVAAWRDRTERHGLEARNPEVGEESGRVSTWVAYDPEGYFLEWDTFLPGEDNQRLIQLLSAEVGR